jgi:hypothetical protein
MEYGEEVSFTHGGKNLNFSTSAFSGFGEDNADGFNFVEEGESDAEHEVCFDYALLLLFFLFTFI